MTKRISPDPSVKDVDMTAADSAVKKAKVDQVDIEAGFEHYPQDQYVISEILKKSRFEVVYMATRARAEVIRLMFEFCGVCFFSLLLNWPYVLRIRFARLACTNTHAAFASDFYRLTTQAQLQWTGPRERRTHPLVSFLISPITSPTVPPSRFPRSLPSSATRLVSLAWWDPTMRRTQSLTLATSVQRRMFSTPCT